MLPKGSWQLVSRPPHPQGEKTAVTCMLLHVGTFHLRLEQRQLEDSEETLPSHFGTWNNSLNLFFFLSQRKTLGKSQFGNDRNVWANYTPPKKHRSKPKKIDGCFSFLILYPQKVTNYVGAVWRPEILWQDGCCHVPKQKEIPMVFPPHNHGFHHSKCMPNICNQKGCWRCYTSWSLVISALGCWLQCLLKKNLGKVHFRGSCDEISKEKRTTSTGLWTPSQKQWQMKGAAPLKCNNPVGDYWEGGQPNIYVITLPFFTTAWIFVIEKSRQETREFEQVTTMSPGKSWRSGLPYLHEASAVRKHILVKPQLLYRLIDVDGCIIETLRPVSVHENCGSDFSLNSQAKSNLYIPLQCFFGFLVLQDNGTEDHLEDYLLYPRCGPYLSFQIFRKTQNTSMLTHRPLATPREACVLDSEVAKSAVTPYPMIPTQDEHANGGDILGQQWNW